MTTRLRVTVQRAARPSKLPSDAAFARWIHAALDGRRVAAELTVRIVDEKESAALNRRFRHKRHATNVLSFPAELPAGVADALLGDLVICAPVVAREAMEQGKAVEAHWAHLTVHGVLHLLGYNHETASQAAEMEPLETAILGALGFPNPYT